MTESAATCFHVGRRKRNTVISDGCLKCLSIWLLIQTLSEDVRGYFLAMISEGQVFVVNSGESVVLDCTFHADQYNLFDYPVLWRKMQRDEESQINIMGNINDPFVASNRFEVAFTATNPRYKLELSILEISQEDSGNYTCEVRGPQSIVLGRVTHYLFVRAPVEDIVVSSGNLSDHNSRSESVMHLVEAVPTSLRCVAYGGYPPPSLELLVGRRDVTSDFLFTHSAVMTGRRGLRTIFYQTERRSNSFIARAEDDGSMLKCVSTVPGHKPLTEYVKLSVDYSPKMICHPAEAFVGEKNVNVRCEIKSKPRLSAMFWIIDSNGTALSEGEVINGLWTLTMDRADGTVDVQLFVRQARLEFFRKYTIIAENNVAIATRDVELHQKFRTTSHLEVATASHIRDKPSRAASAKNRVFLQNCAWRHRTDRATLTIIVMTIVTITTTDGYPHFSP